MNMGIAHSLFDFMDIFTTRTGFETGILPGAGHLSSMGVRVPILKLMDMEKMNKITATRQLILQAVKDLAGRLGFDTDTLEAEMGPDTMVYVQLLCQDWGGYYGIDILEVCVNKDTYRRECILHNISEFICQKLAKQVKRINTEAYEEYFYI